MTEVILNDQQFQLLLEAAWASHHRGQDIVDRLDTLIGAMVPKACPAPAAPPAMEGEEESAAAKALFRLSTAIGNPALVTEGTLEDALVDLVIARLDEARVHGYRSAMNDKTNGELGAIEARAREDGAREERNHIRPLFEELMGHVEIPERNCSCHISPPCEDCVEYAGLRETVSALRTALERP